MEFPWSPRFSRFELALLTDERSRTVVRAGNVTIGHSEFVVMAGPCAVESEWQVRATAEAVAAAGARVLRGGAFKPRTSPYSFQGLGEEGLKILRRAADSTGLAVVTEVMCPEDVALVSEYAEILQVGSRSMENFALLEAVGRSSHPVLLKRGMTATLEEFLQSAEVVLRNGNPDVILCERGIRTFDAVTRNTLDVAAMPVLKSVSHLPVIVDPSHAAGARALVLPLARAATVAGADGLLVEVHPAPETALSDGVQSLTFAEFRNLMTDLQPYVALAADMREPELIAAGKVV